MVFLGSWLFTSKCFIVHCEQTSVFSFPLTSETDIIWSLWFCIWVSSLLQPVRSRWHTHDIGLTLISAAFNALQSFPPLAVFSSILTTLSDSYLSNSRTSVFSLIAWKHRKPSPCSRTASVTVVFKSQLNWMDHFCIPQAYQSGLTNPEMPQLLSITITGQEAGQKITLNITSIHAHTECHFYVTWKSLFSESAPQKICWKAWEKRGRGRLGWNPIMSFIDFYSYITPSSSWPFNCQSTPVCVTCTLPPLYLCFGCNSICLKGNVLPLLFIFFLLNISEEAI